jgi:hypothetical protein
LLAGDVSFGKLQTCRDLDFGGHSDTFSLGGEGDN